MRALRVMALGLLLAPLLCAQTPVPSVASAPTDNSKQARAVLDAMVKALGGDAWLNLQDTYYEGRTSSFYQGRPTGIVIDYYAFHEFPDKDRTELTKKKNVIEMFVGNQGWEITYKGKRAIPDKDRDEFLRRRDHSIEIAIRVWLKDPHTLLIYDGQKLAERHLSDQVTLISSTNDSITIQTDADTHLPLSRTFEWRDPVYKDKNVEVEEYADYHTIQGFPTAFSITRFHNGDMTNQRFLSKAGYNFPMPTYMFNPDAAAAKIHR